MQLNLVMKHLERHHVAGLEVHLGAPGAADLVDAVAEFVAAVLAAAQAQALVEGVSGAAAIRPALVRPVHQRVDEQVNGALVRAFDDLVHVVYAVGGDELHGVLNVAARLEGAAVGINVHVTHGSLDADAEVRRASGVCVQDVHKGGIVR